MRIRAGIVLVEDGRVALIERHRAGLDYYVFPGGGVDEGETCEQAAVREAKEELGIDVVVKKKVAEIHFELSTQIYFLVERVGGEFGTGVGEEFTDSDPDNPEEGIYIPIWMPLEELRRHDNVYPAGMKELLLKAQTDRWSEETVVIVEKSV